MAPWMGCAQSWLRLLIISLLCGVLASVGVTASSELLPVWSLSVLQLVNVGWHNAFVVSTQAQTAQTVQRRKPFYRAFEAFSLSVRTRSTGRCTHYPRAQSEGGPAHAGAWLCKGRSELGLAPFFHCRS